MANKAVNKTLTLKQALDMVQSGKIAVFGIYRSGKVSGQMVRDAKNGGRRQAYVARHVILTDEDVLTATSWLPDGETDETWVAPANKNDKVVFFIQQMETTNGTPNIQRGELFTILG